MGSYWRRFELILRQYQNMDVLIFAHSNGERGGESVSFLFRSGSKFFLTSPKTTNLQFQLHSSKNQMILRVVFQGLHHGTCQLEIRSAGDSTGAPELLTG